MITVLLGLGLQNMPFNWLLTRQLRRDFTPHGSFCRPHAVPVTI